MFKICMRRAVRLVSFCAILFLALSLLNTRQTVQTVAGAGYKEINENDARGPFEGSNYQTGKLVGASGASSPSLSPLPVESAGEQLESRQRFRKPAAAGKIFDYLTTNNDNELKGRHHLLVPRLAKNSTASLMRLIVGPFKSTKTIISSRIGQENESSRSFASGKEVDVGLNKDKADDEISPEGPQSSTKCDKERRPGGYKRAFRAARRLLTSGFSSIEQRAGGLLGLGSSLLVALIPLASIFSDSSGPQYQFVNSSEMAAQTINTSHNSFGLPSKLAHYLPDSNSLQNKLELVLGLLERSSQKLPTFPNLHPTECIKRSVCEAHYEPEEYGIMGALFIKMFPAVVNENTEQSTVLAKYLRAAEVGEKQRHSNGTSFGLTNKNPCTEKFPDCSVSLLHVGKRMIDRYLA